MKRTLQIAGLLLLLAGAIPLPATSQPATASPISPVRPGEWEILPQSSAGMSISYRLCFKGGGTDDLQLLLPRVPLDTTCPVPESTLGGAVWEWRLACPGRSLEMAARYQLGPDLIEGAITLTQGMPPQTSQQGIVARRVGACPG